MFNGLADFRYATHEYLIEHFDPLAFAKAFNLFNRPDTVEHFDDLIGIQEPFLAVLLHTSLIRYRFYHCLNLLPIVLLYLDYFISLETDVLAIFSCSNVYDCILVKLLADHLVLSDGDDHVLLRISEHIVELTFNSLDDMVVFRYQTGCLDEYEQSGALGLIDNPLKGHMHCNIKLVTL